jgi:hypothetical protein
MMGPQDWMPPRGRWHRTLLGGSAAIVHLFAGLAIHSVPPWCVACLFFFETLSDNGSMGWSKQVENQMPYEKGLRDADKMSIKSQTRDQEKGLF